LKTIFLISVLFIGLHLKGQGKWRSDFDRLSALLSLPNDAHDPADIENNLKWLSRAFEDLDFEVSRLSTEGLDLLFAERYISDSLPTVLFYMHFDGQPVDSSKWWQQNPYKPVVRDHALSSTEETISPHDMAYGDIFKKDIRVYARSASDDKGPIAMYLSALSHLKMEGAQPTFNVKLILDGEEELGSPNLEAAVDVHQKKLEADYFVVFDGPMHDSGRPTLFFGIRGVTTLHLEVYGMMRPQHSGHFGNYGPNPVFRAASLLNSMKDENGKVRIKGYYEGIILDEEIKRTMSNVPDNKKTLQQRGGFKEPEKVGITYQEAMQYPSLNVVGISSGWVGNQTRTIVPDKATIEMDIRTVVESNPVDLIEKIQEHIKAQGFTILDHRPSEEEMLTIEKPLYLAYEHLMFPFRTPLDSDIGNWLRRALGSKDVVQIRTVGGSVPLSFFINKLDVPTVLVPLVNSDNNQHSPNENLKLSNYFDGIETIKQIFRTKING
jgi:acetylornithine deacetylase/succinyl-diaminopimelate desuccinylase-like protein